MTCALIAERVKQPGLFGGAGMSSILRATYERAMKGPNNE